MLTDMSSDMNAEGSPRAKEVPMNQESQALAAYNVPDSRIPNLELKVTRLARRAAKLGMAQVALVQVKPGPRTKHRLNGATGRPETYELPCTWVELRGPSPVLSGYTFLARIEHTDAGNLVSRVPGNGDAIDLTAYRTAAAVCEHCKSKRQRKDTFVLSTPEGGLVQIGRNCLADYIRSENVDMVVAMIELTNELSSASGEDGDLDDWEGGGGGWTLIVTVEHYLAASVVAVREFGWVSRGAVRAGLPKTPTASHVSFITGPRPKGNGRGDEEARREWDRLQPREEDVARAGLVMAWIQASTDATDYMHNLRVAVALQATTPRTQGLLASAPSAYAREVEKQIANQAKANRAPSAHVGEVGKRMTFRLRLVRKPVVDTDWGGLAIHIFEDESGNVLLWKTGTGDLEIGRVYDVKGTVKKHTDFKGTKQTELSRCVATEVKADGS